MTHRREVDIAVIGAGVLGLATAEALVRRGADVLVFDGRPPGAGLSGGLTRTFRHRHDNELHVAMAVEGRRGFARWEQRLGRELIGPEGAVYHGMDHSHVTGMAAQRVEHSFVPGAVGGEVFPALARVGTPLLVDPGAGAIRAKRTIDALAHWVGDRIVQADVHSVTVPSDGDGAEFQTTEAIYRARHVVICAGTAVTRLGASVGFDIPVRSALHARPHFRVRPEFAGTPLPCWVDISGEFGVNVYGSPIGATGTYVVGMIGPAVDVPFGPDGGLPPGTDMEEHVRRVSAYVAKALPGLDPEPVGARVCVMTKLPKGSDALRAWHRPGVTTIAGHNLFKMAPALGELLADAAEKDQLPEALERAGADALEAA
ncbi:sarcosine oxidase [Actinokineospora baliensis]|uniref:NAD(P)/FAD-dependent oxidoreductase n=1 Tax=Actinokineospora baliensis TaxID=547056 RepID=UPI00195BE24C|nr:FAD-dependent oxidoreductase [Actinokineospora baliensis]MBM7773206.1 sarcosine oxidase [Actinokineospora baliensis]